MYPQGMQAEQMGAQVRSSEIRGQINQLAERIEVLSITTNHLQETLGPVLRGAYPTEAVSNEAKAAGREEVPLAEDLRHFNVLLSGIIEQQQLLLQRIAL